MARAKKKKEEVKLDENRERIIMGLDVSTNCTGISIVRHKKDEGTKVLFIDRIKFKSSKNFKGTDALFYKSKQFIEFFNKNFNDFKVTDIVIEEPLMMSNNSVTAAALMKFNGMISQLLFEKYGLLIKYISSYDARKFAFPELLSIRKYNKQGEEYTVEKIRKALKHNDLVLFGNYSWDCQKKLILWNKVSEMYPDIKWIYDNNNELTTENFDASDSLICILGFINKEIYGNTEPKIEGFTEEKINSNNIKLTRFKYNTNFCNQVYNKIVDISII